MNGPHFDVIETGTRLRERKHSKPGGPIDEMVYFVRLKAAHYYKGPAVEGDCEIELTSIDAMLLADFQLGTSFNLVNNAQS
jgi:hypothetical protein